MHGALVSRLKEQAHVTGLEFRLQKLGGGIFDVTYGYTLEGERPLVDSFERWVVRFLDSLGDE